MAIHVTSHSAISTEYGSNPYNRERTLTLVAPPCFICSASGSAKRHGRLSSAARMTIPGIVPVLLPASWASERLAQPRPACMYPAYHSVGCGGDDADGEDGDGDDDAGDF
ncbi:predicted protein [Histoplasma capsulatum H143]|uniref:Uncharacterized protein n=1 Tax=Ajellomyces capsulatus (strain H143) TaxID=544712 RepID=C6HII9_AJECH|nr:predicted protein [Histoplasma capsulatum H143]